MRALTCFSIAQVFLAACGPVPPSSSLEGARSAVPALATAFSACDLEKVASMYSETAEFLAPDTPRPVIGRNAVAKHLSGACTATYKPIMKVLNQRAYALGRDGAVVSGTYSIGRTDRASDAPWVAAFVVTLVSSSSGWLIQSQATFPGPT
jgi:ketosteroid isomerase-like protein